MEAKLNRAIYPIGRLSALYALEPGSNLGGSDFLTLVSYSNFTGVQGGITDKKE